MDLLLFSSLFVLIVQFAASEVANRERFEHFDDFLRHAIQSQIDSRASGTGTGAQEPPAPVGLPSDAMISDQPNSYRRAGNHLPSTPNLDVLSFFRDIPKRHWSCCLLGKLAGDKGFHCQAQFYAERVLSENRNRPHNRYMPFNGPAQDMAYGRDLMEHFSRCVSRKEEQFHTCCYAATMERLALNRWRRYLNHRASMRRLHH